MSRAEAHARAVAQWGPHAKVIDILDVLYRVGFVDSQGDPCWMGTGRSYEEAFQNADDLDKALPSRRLYRKPSVPNA